MVQNKLLENVFFRLCSQPSQQGVGSDRDLIPSGWTHTQSLQVDILVWLEAFQTLCEQQEQRVIP